MFAPSGAAASASASRFRDSSGPLGRVASDWRKKYNIWGTHLSANNKTRNFMGLGICLIGNFEERPVPQKQFDSLVSLTKQLMNRYNIAPENVLTHGRIEGESSKCPGRLFPHEAFTVEISKR